MGESLCARKQGDVTVVSWVAKKRTISHNPPRPLASGRVEKANQSFRTPNPSPEGKIPSPTPPRPPGSRGFSSGPGRYFAALRCEKPIKTYGFCIKSGFLASLGSLAACSSPLWVSKTPLRAFLESFGSFFCLCASFFSFLCPFLSNRWPYRGTLWLRDSLLLLLRRTV